MHDPTQRLRRSLALGCVALLAVACGGGGDGEPADREPASRERADVATAGDSNAGPTSPRGVVLFVVDTLRADRFSVDGYSRATSPTIDALAERGTRWTRNFAQGGWTVPSMLSMMTGLYLGEESEALPVAQPTLAELLSESGIETAAFVGNRILTRTRGFERGFDHFDYPLRPRGPDSARATRTHEWVERFENWHAARENRDRPWFAWIHVFDPHGPYAPTERFDRFQNSATPLESELLRPRWIAARDDVRDLQPDGFSGLTVEKAVRTMFAERASYDAEVLETDAGVERLVAYLERYAGGFDDVLLVIAADHGELLYEYPDHLANHQSRVKTDGGLPRGLADYFGVGHTGFLEDEVWRTPLMMVGPGVEAGRVDERLSANLDIAPTVLDAFGVDHGETFQGRSKLQGGAERDVVFGITGNMTAVRTSDGLHLVELNRRYVETDGTGMTARLYDDPEPGRATDIADRRPADVLDLRGRIEDWRPTALFETNDAVDTSGERDILEALGYLDHGVGAPKVDD